MTLENVIDAYNTALQTPRALNEYPFLRGGILQLYREEKISKDVYFARPLLYTELRFVKGNSIEALYKAGKVVQADEDVNIAKEEFDMKTLEDVISVVEGFNGMPNFIKNTISDDDTNKRIPDSAY